MDLTEATRRMAYRVRGMDPLGRRERRITSWKREASLALHEFRARPEGRIRRAAETMFASLWVARHPELQRQVLTGEVSTMQKLAPCGASERRTQNEERR